MLLELLEDDDEEDELLEELEPPPVDEELLEEELLLDEELLELDEVVLPLPPQAPRLVQEASLPGTLLVYQLARYRLF